VSAGILVVDGDSTARALLDLALREAGFEATCVPDGRTALEHLDAGRPDAVVLDLHLDDVHGLDVLERVRGDHPGLPVVVTSARADVDTAVRCMRAGAHDFLQKPFDNARLLDLLGAATRGGAAPVRDALSAERRQERGFESLRGDSRSLLQVLGLVRKAVSKDVTVLIQGESGTGKEVLARAIHAESQRADGPFVPINCGAIPESLIESELFGHEKGSFTGAHSTRLGLFEQAEGGVVFLDEVGELRPDLQVRLLRVLQERKVKRLGSNVERTVDVRVIAATNLELSEEVRSGKFREDLFYRLAVFPVTLPPLRERGDDVLLLAEHFLAKVARDLSCSVFGLSEEVEATLRTYPWPGNVRELQNVVERAVIVTDGPEIVLDDLTETVAHHRTAGSAVLPGPGAMDEAPSHPEEIVPLDEVERRTVLSALGATNWNVSETAERLRIGRATLYRRINQYGFTRDGEPAGEDTSVEEQAA
jgi:DNA-binding NtrC family response regulator